MASSTRSRIKQGVVARVADPPVAPRHEGVLLFLCFTVVSLSVVLTPSASSVSFAGFEIPAVCAFRQIFGTDCLGCGLTRSFVFMGHGKIGAAFEAHILGPVGWLLVASQLPWRTYLLIRRRNLRSE